MSKAIELFDEFNLKAFKDINDPKVKEFVKNIKEKISQENELNRLEMVMDYILTFKIKFGNKNEKQT